jgi:voltage-gated potassium channel
MPTEQDRVHRALERERWALLHQLEEWLDLPMVILGFVWLGLLVMEFTWGLSPVLARLSNIIWIVFILDFGVKLSLAPKRLDFLRRNWLTALSLLAPALRVIRVVSVVRIVRAARTVRGLRLLRVVSSTNRGMKALRASMGRRGLSYVVALTALVTVAGAAGMYTFERESPGGFDSFAVALWWTAMIMTTLGSDYWPKSPEGRVLALLLALYAFTVFGYVTASLATFFIGRDAASVKGEVAGQESISALRAEIAALRAELRTLNTPSVARPPVVATGEDPRPPSPPAPLR